MHQLFGKTFFLEIPHEFQVGKFNSSKGHRRYLDHLPKHSGVKTTIKKKNILETKKTSTTIEIPRLFRLTLLMEEILLGI